MAGPELRREDDLGRVVAVVEAAPTAQAAQAGVLRVDPLFGGAVAIHGDRWAVLVVAVGVWLWWVWWLWLWLWLLLLRLLLLLLRLLLLRLLLPLLL